jgi:4-diphosphocytidyl-2-C-methyl-D-erythritol kinase
MDELITSNSRIHSKYKCFFAPAKINLFLKILEKQDDGYHSLQSVFQLIDLYDELYFKKRKDNKISIQYNVQSIKKENDLCAKAANLILKGLNVGVDIVIKKNIPIGGGLGGGSSDAATTLLALNKLFNINFKKKKLMDFGLALGADVPFFIYGTNAWAEGIGEKLSPISIGDNEYLLFIPNIPISTKSIFKDFKLTKKSIPLKIATSINDVAQDQILNDLHDNILEKYPKLRELIDWLKEYGEPKITGTGSTLFMKSNNVKYIKEIYKKKPKDIKIIRVRGLSVHPHFLTD